VQFPASKINNQHIKPGGIFLGGFTNNLGAENEDR